MVTGERSLSRAEAVRARRVERRTDKPLQGRSANNSYSIPAARMVARNPLIERRLAAASGVRERRPHYLKLAEAGAELRLPVLPQLRIGWRFVSGAVVAACLFVLYFMAFSDVFTVSAAELTGAQRLTPAAINTALKISGSSIFSLQPDQMLATLRSEFPELEKVSVGIGFPAGVTVRAVERQPVLAWQQAGLTVWVDDAGVAFTPQGDGQSLVQVTAEEAPPALAPDQYGRHQLISPDMVSAIKTLSQIAPAGSSLIYDPSLGFGWTDPGGWKAFFGADGSDIVQRMAVYRSILTELATRNLTPTLISVAQLHAPYYRLDY